MGATTRKDYGSNAIVSPSNPTMRAIGNINAPYSVQATGHDKNVTGANSGNVIDITSANLDVLAVNTRVLQGNRIGYVKSVVIGEDPDPEVLETCTIRFLGDLGEEDAIDVDYTKDELLASDNLILVSP